LKYVTEHSHKAQNRTQHNSTVGQPVTLRAVCILANICLRLLE